MKESEIIIALDFEDAGKTMDFLEKFDEKLYVKVGMELFYSEGAQIVKEIKKLGHRIFLDLKLHDIPNTVRRTMTVLAAIGVDMVNVHAAGGIAMMKAAAQGLAEKSNELAVKRPLLIAVTQLTSTDNEIMNKELLIPGDVKEVAAAYAETARSAGLDGVVCSAWEAEEIHKKCGMNFKTVTPGIRLAGNVAADQKRIATPERASKMGTDYMVIGRSITASDDPVSAYARCREEIKQKC